MQVRTPKTELLNAPEFQIIRHSIRAVYEKCFNDFENYRPVVLSNVGEKSEKIFQQRLKEIEDEIFFTSKQHDCRICKENITEIAKIVFINKKGDIVYP